MLTRDLLNHRTQKGVIRPVYVKVDDPKLLALADDLVAIVEGAVGSERRELTEGLDARSKGFKRQKIAKGFVKLLLDRTSFEEPGEDAAALRMSSFQTARAIMMALEPDTTIVEYEAKLDDALDQPIEAVRELCYADLLENRRLIAWKALTGVRLLERYNLALVQGLVMNARRVSLSFASADITAVRRVLRWLKFCRLVADLEKSDAVITLHIEGPAAMFASSKKYGLQLATFVQIVPLLAHFVLESTVELPRRDAAAMTVTEADGLVSPLRSGVGHIPDEVTAVLSKLEDDETWRVDLDPVPRTVGANGWCVPDLCFKHRAQDVSIGIELFHTWHRGALLKRLEELSSRPDASLYLGVDRSIAKHADVAPLIDGRDDVFLFNKFPSVRALSAVLARHA